MEAENVAAVRAMVQLINGGELEELLDRFVAEDIELDHTRSLSPDQAGIFRGIDGVRRFWAATREPWEEVVLVADEYIEVRDDTVVVASHTRQVGRGSGIEVVAHGAIAVSASRRQGRQVAALPEQGGGAGGRRPVRQLVNAPAAS